METEVLWLRPPLVSGNWYAPCPFLYAAGIALIANNLRLIEIPVVEDITIDGMAALITTLSAAGNIQLGIYASDPDTNLPVGNPIATTGNLSTGSTGAVSETFTAVDLPKGFYWMGVNSDNNTVVCKSFNTGQAISSYFHGSATLTNVTASATNSALLKTFAVTFGTWPDLTGETFIESTGNNTAAIYVRAA